jgi:hypothetical protein
MKTKGFPRVISAGPNSRSVTVLLSPLTNVSVVYAWGAYVATWGIRHRAAGWMVVNRLKLASEDDAIALLLYDLRDPRAADRVHRWSVAAWAFLGSPTQRNDEKPTPTTNGE